MIDLLPGVQTTASALSAERIRMDVISQNIANINTTRGLDGRPYQRQHVVFESALQQHLGTDSGAPTPTLKVARVERDHRPYKLVHDPGHPDANSDGMVAMPDINIHEEMVDLITSSRAFEANLAVLKNARSIAVQTLGIGKRT